MDRGRQHVPENVQKVKKNVAMRYGQWGHEGYEEPQQQQPSSGRTATNTNRWDDHDRDREAPLTDSWEDHPQEHQQPTSESSGQPFSEGQESSHKARNRVPRGRRPDKQVYVPRGRRLQPQPDEDAAAPVSSSSRPPGSPDQQLHCAVSPGGLTDRLDPREIGESREVKPRGRGRALRRSKQRGVDLVQTVRRGKEVAESACGDRPGSGQGRGQTGHQSSSASSSAAEQIYIPRMKRLQMEQEDHSRAATKPQSFNQSQPDFPGSEVAHDQSLRQSIIAGAQWEDAPCAEDTCGRLSDEHQRVNQGHPPHLHSDDNPDSPGGPLRAKKASKIPSHQDRGEEGIKVTTDGHGSHRHRHKKRRESKSPGNKQRETSEDGSGKSASQSEKAAPNKALRSKRSKDASEEALQGLVRPDSRGKTDQEKSHTEGHDIVADDLRQTTERMEMDDHLSDSVPMGNRIEPVSQCCDETTKKDLPESLVCGENYGKLCDRNAGTGSDVNQSHPNASDQECSDVCEDMSEPLGTNQITDQETPTRIEVSDRARSGGEYAACIPVGDLASTLSQDLPTGVRESALELNPVASTVVAEEEPIHVDRGVEENATQPFTVTVQADEGTANQMQQGAEKMETSVDERLHGGHVPGHDDARQGSGVDSGVPLMDHSISSSQSICGSQASDLCQQREHSLGEGHVECPTNKASHSESPSCTTRYPKSGSSESAMAVDLSGGGDSCLGNSSPLSQLNDEVGELNHATQDGNYAAHLSEVKPRSDQVSDEESKLNEALFYPDAESGKRGSLVGDAFPEAENSEQTVQRLGLDRATTTTVAQAGVGSQNETKCTAPDSNQARTSPVNSDDSEAPVDPSEVENSSDQLDAKDTVDQSGEQDPSSQSEVQVFGGQSGDQDLSQSDLKVFGDQSGDQDLNQSDAKDETQDQPVPGPDANQSMVTTNAGASETSSQATAEEKKEEPMDEDDDADSWDKLFDDTGEALDPALVEELTTAVGEVQIQKTQFDYLQYQPKDIDLDMQEYGHLIEIYDFSTDLLTRDIVVAFKDFMNKGFDVKWVDDTHAIGIFASPIAAQSALEMKYGLLKVRPVCQATRQTKLKAKRCNEFLQPYKPRPETVASVARNLVTGALGIQSKVPKEKRDEERRKIKEAKEKKRQAVQQKRDAWDGSAVEPVQQPARVKRDAWTIGRCAMDEET